MNEAPSLAEIPRKVTLADLLDQRIATQCKRLGEEMPVFALLMTGNLDLGTLAKTMQQGGDDGCKEGLGELFRCLNEKTGLVALVESLGSLWEKIFDAQQPATLPSTVSEQFRVPGQGAWDAAKGIESGSLQIDQIVRLNGGWELVLGKLAVLILGLAVVLNIGKHILTAAGDWWESTGDE